MFQQGFYTPKHLMLDDQPYFITGAIDEKRPLLAAEVCKARLIELFHECFAEHGWLLGDWVVLDNHYHLLCQSGKGERLPRLMRCLHANSARTIRAETGCELPVWWNYWDYCPRGEADYRVRQNYLFNNPFKHGYVTDLRDYPYSTFHRTLEAEGRETLARRFRAHPGYRTLSLPEDDF